jgi:hypothetical protein
MPGESEFDNAPAYDEDGRLVIKSTCTKCGESNLVSVRDKSLAKWESRHDCMTELNPARNG